MAATALDKARAERDALQLQLDAERRTAAELRDDRDHWRAAMLPDPEAEALAACVRAITAMQAQQRERSRGATNQYGSFRSYTGEIEPYRPAALDHPVGRILLSLAARYGLAIEATPPRVQKRTGDVLVEAPADMADQIRQLVEQRIMRDMPR